jgi:hypothetical protein
VALVGGTVVAVNAFGGSDDSTSTPDAPVRALLDAAASGNVSKMIDQLVPGERDALQQPITDLVGQLERLGVLGKLDLGNVGAYKLRIDGLALDTQTRRADLSFVKITGGTATYSFDPADLPLGPLLSSVLGAKPTSSPTSGSTSLGGGGDTGLVTVKQDGHWYVSIGYTIAEQARTASGASLDELGQRVTAAGAATPEDAVRQLVRAGAALDLRGVLALLPPGEMGALQEYAGLLLPAATSALAGDADAPKITIDGLDVSAKVDGDSAVVKVDKLDATVVTGATTTTLRDGCVTVAAPGQQPAKTCPGDATGMLGNLGALGGGGLPGLDKLAAGAVTGLRAVRVDGTWYVSPVHTVLDNLVATLRAIQPGDLSGLAQTLQGLTKTLESGGGIAPDLHLTTPTTAG